MAAPEERRPDVRTHPVAIAALILSLVAPTLTVPVLVEIDELNAVYLRGQPNASASNAELMWEVAPLAFFSDRGAPVAGTAVL